MANDPTVKVNFIGDSSSLKRAADDADGHLSRIGDSIGKFAKVAAIGLGAVAVGMGAFAKSSIAAAQESAKITAQTAAVIKSTGAAAHVTANQVADLATAISNKTGIDDEAIQSGQNLLLTFTNLQNRVGKGNDIFNQATQVMVDMGAALGQDASSSAIQLGKALNDPIKGITALTRVGVTFSAEQKKQIKTMQEAGDIAGAQKVILKELTTEFGGSAAAQSTAAQRMKVAFGNLQEQIGGMLIPVVEKLSTFLTDKVIPAMSRLASEAMPKIQEAFDWLRTNVPPVAAEFARIATDVFEQRLIPAFKEVAQIIMERVWPAIKTTFDFLMDHKEILVGIAVAIGVGLVAAFLSWAAAAGAAAIATITALAPIIAIGVAIAALVAGVIYAYTHWGWFKAAVDAVGDALVWVGHHFDDMLNIVKGVIDWITEHWALLLTVLLGPFGLAVVAIIKNFDTIREAFADVYGFFVMIAGKLYDAITGPFAAAFSWISDQYDKYIKPIFGAIDAFAGVIGAPRGGGQAEFDKKFGGKAMGGPVMGGTPYWVGERGPELFVPGSSGSIVPNGGGQQAITLNIDGRSFMSWLVDYSNNNGGLPIRIR